MVNEKRLIDANALTKLMCRACNNECCEEPCEPGECFIYDAVSNAPTVDFVEVVRCKECKYWADGVQGCTNHVKCCKIGFYMVGENGYCVYGERRTDG